jgi:hypothetical protein
LKKIIYFLICFVFVIFCNVSFAGKGIEIIEKDNYNQATFPAGSLFEALITYEISTEINNVGDEVELIISSDMTCGDLTLIEKDTKFVGEIIKLQRAIQGQNGYIQILLDKIVFPDGKSGKILAHIWTKDNNGIIGGDFTQRSKFKQMPHYIQGIGAVAQAIPTGPRLMGTETYILSGAQFRIVLDEDLSLILPKD